MKIAVSGKGGVGKTTISANLIRFLAQRGYKVFAVDADADASLGTVLGIPDEILSRLKPLIELKEEIAARSGGGGAFYSLNPNVESVLDEFGIKLGENISFLKMGGIKKGGTACYCRENTFLHAVVSSLLLDKNEVVVLDMGAGIEHLTRGTAKGVDLMLIVTEPTKVSIQTAKVVQQLAGDLGVANIKVVGNKIRNDKEIAFLKDNFSSDDLLGFVRFDDEILADALESASDNKPGEPNADMALIFTGILNEQERGR